MAGDAHRPLPPADTPLSAGGLHTHRGQAAWTLSEQSQAADTIDFAPALRPLDAIG